jgi:hypothetical protein
MKGRRDRKDRSFSSRSEDRYRRRSDSRDREERKSGER